MSYTVENTSMRLWFSSRSHVVATQKFDFQKVRYPSSFSRNKCADHISLQEPEKLIRFVISTHFANLEDLGYDLNVQRVMETREGKECVTYDVTIGEKTFRLVDALDTHRASRILGRGTKVWTAYDKSDPERKPLVLKDYWLAYGAELESTIQANIFAKLEKRGLDPKEYKRHFMRFHTDQVVKLSSDRDDDSAASNQIRFTDRIRLRHPPLKSRPTKARVPGSDSKPSGAVPGSGGLVNFAEDGDNSTSMLELSPDTAQSQLTQLYQGRRHVRSIFWDVGVPLHKVENHRILFAHMKFALQGMLLKPLGYRAALSLFSMPGLSLLYLAEYVHKDISVGNCKAGFWCLSTC